MRMEVIDFDRSYRTLSISDLIAVRRQEAGLLSRRFNLQASRVLRSVQIRVALSDGCNGYNVSMVIPDQRSLEVAMATACTPHAACQTCYCKTGQAVRPLLGENDAWAKQQVLFQRF